MKHIYNLFNNFIAFLLGLMSGCTVLVGGVLFGVLLVLAEKDEKEKPNKVSYKSYYASNSKARPFPGKQQNMSMMQDQDNNDIEEGSK